MYLEGGIIPAFLDSVAQGMAGEHIGTGEGSTFQLVRTRFSLTTTLGIMHSGFCIKPFNNSFRFFCKRFILKFAIIASYNVSNFKNK